MRRPKTAAVLVITGLVAIAAVYLLATQGKKDGNGTGTSTGPAPDAPPDPELLGLWHTIKVARAKKPKPGPGVRIDGSWLDGICEYEKSHPGVIRRFLFHDFHDKAEIDAKTVALHGYRRYMLGDVKRVKDMLDMAVAILDHETPDTRFILIREEAVGMMSFCAKLQKTSPEAYKRSFDILLERFDAERGAKMFASITSALTRYSRADILVPKLIARFESLDPADEYNVLFACPIVRAVADSNLWSKESDEFLVKVAREYLHPTVRATAVIAINKARAPKVAVPIFEELLKTEKDPGVIEQINKALKSKRGRFHR
ncbi:MAG: hypothetical protein E3J72_01715 [Planctomycetota bacterium]|nr:MAG: hypothetical protein E3J72_01715 [Planctomycetota bacterium]